MALGIEKISTNLVGTTLGTSSRDVGTLCRHSAINIYSKYKPVAHTSMAAADYYKALYTGAEAGKSGDYGLRAVQFSIPITSEAGDIKASFNSMYASNWSYRKPIGGINERFRLGDFRLYEHSAIPFIIANSIQPTYKFLTSSSDDLTITFNTNPGGTSNIKATDLFGGSLDLSKWKLYGMLIKVNSIAGSWIPVAESLPILNSSGVVQVTELTFTDLLGLPFTQYELHLGLRSTEDGTKYIPLPKLPNTSLYNDFPFIFSVMEGTALEAGNGIVDDSTGVAFFCGSVSPSSNVKLAVDSTFEYSGDYVMNNSNGEIYTRLSITNQSASPVTINNGDIIYQLYNSASSQYIGQYTATIKENVGGYPGGNISSVTIYPGDYNTQDVWIHHTNCLSGLTNPVVEIKIGTYILFKKTLRYTAGTAGWNYSAI